MKVLTLIVHAAVQQDIGDILRGLEKVSGFTITHVEGHGAQTDSDPFLSARDKVVGHVPRVRVEILIADENIDAVLDAVCGTACSVRGQGVYWITSIDRHGRL